MKNKFLVPILIFILVVTIYSMSVPTVSAIFPRFNGKILFDSDRDGNVEIYVMNADGTGQTRLTNNDAYDFYPKWSPDGSKIAFVSNRDTTDGTTEVYVMDADGSNPKRLTNNAGFESSLSWSPDGNKIAFSSDMATRETSMALNDIYVMNADGSGITRF